MAKKSRRNRGLRASNASPPRAPRPQAPLFSLRSQPSRSSWIVQNYAVAFFDLLGASNALEGLNALNDPHRDREEVVHAVECAWRPVWWMRKAFEDYFSTALNNNLSSPSAMLLSPQKRRELSRLLKKRVIGQSISDSVVFSVPFYDTDDHYQPMVGITTMLDACSAMVPVMLASGEFMNPGVGTAPRGGIELGAGAGVSDGEVISAGLVHAYKLEKSADWPRVAVGPTMIECLEDVAQTPGDSNPIAIGRELAKKALLRIRREENGSSYLDPLSADLRSSLGESYEFMLPYAYRFSRRKAAELSAIGNVKDANKYQNVVQYFEAHAPDIVSQEPEVAEASVVAAAGIPPLL